MSIEFAGIIAELIAAAAVVISLIYLAAQVKDSANQSTGGMTFAIIDDFNRIQDLIIASPELNSLLTKLRNNLEIDDLETTLLQSIATRYLTHWLAVQSAQDRNLLDSTVYKANCEDVERMIREYPAMHLMFKKIMKSYSIPQSLPIFQSLFRG